MRIGKDKWLTLEFKLQDFWMGVFWDRRQADFTSIARGAQCIEELHIWICLIPCFPIHLIIGSKYRETCEEWDNFKLIYGLREVEGPDFYPVEPALPSQLLLWKDL